MGLERLSKLISHWCNWWRKVLKQISLMAKYMQFLHPVCLVMIRRLFSLKTFFYFEDLLFWLIESSGME